MWILSNQTKLAAANAWLRAKDGRLTWVVCAKATYDILPDGAVALAAEQEPVHLEAKFGEDPAASSLEHDTDIVLGKPASDVIVRGSAWAERGKPTTELVVGLDVGPIRKSLHVVGDRMFKHGA